MLIIYRYDSDSYLGTCGHNPATPSVSACFSLGLGYFFILTPSLNSLFRLSSRVDSRLSQIERKKGHPNFGLPQAGVPRTTIFDIAQTAGFPSVGLVGRLDFETSGVMLMTNDNLLATALRSPIHDVRGSDDDENKQSVHEVQVEDMKCGSCFDSSERNVLREMVEPESRNLVDSPNVKYLFKEKIYEVKLLAQRESVMSRSFTPEELEELRQQLCSPLTFNRNGYTQSTDSANIEIVSRALRLKTDNKKFNL